MPKTGADLIMNGEIILSGQIIMDEYAGWMWEEDVFFTPRMLREALAMIDGPVTARLNSLGGHVWAGEQMRAIVAGHPQDVRMIVEGIAASAASLLLMGADERLMSSGSQLMIHDPSSFAWGTEEELRREADVLGASAEVYAAVYAAASGKSPEEMRRIMKDETWFGPRAAIENGFADGLSDAEADDPAPAAIAAAQSRFMEFSRVVRMRMSQMAEGQKPRRPTAAPDGTPAEMAITEQEEAPMPPKETTAPAPAAPTPTMVAPPAPADQIAAERARVRGIREMTAPFVASGRLTQADVDVMVDDGTEVAAAGQKAMAIMAAHEPAVRSPGGGARITRDETDTKIAGMVDAMMGKTDGPAAQYRGMRVKRLAMELSGSRTFDEMAAIRAGMRATTMMGGAYGVSDFAYITTEVMNRSLLEQYQRRANTWQLVTGTPLRAADFREIHAARFGGDFSLKAVSENGEYQSATLVDEAEGLKVERRGRAIRLTFEAVVNDDMGAFQRIPGEFALAARTMENGMVWSLIRTNAVLKSDGIALFHANHKNLAASGSALSVTSVAAGRKALWEQRAPGVKDGDDFLQLEADLIIVPPALETVALQFTAAIVATKDGDTNPYKSNFRPVIVPNLGAAAGGSDTAWYLGSSDRPAISVAYLEGYEAPTIVQTELTNPDTISWDARHIFGAAATEFRGIYKNAGA